MAISPLEVVPVPIVSDAAIAIGGVLNGRPVPVLILDTSDRTDIVELLRVQRHLPPGDVACSWGTRPRCTSTVLLLLAFSRPSELKILLEFGTVRQGTLVEFILDARALYLQSGTDGERLSLAMDQDRMLLEVPSTGFEPAWNSFLRRELRRDFRGKGMTTKQANQAVKQTIEEWRRLREWRIGP